MELYYETERLILRILREDSAPDVLDFYSKNRAVFELWEPDRPQNFYTKEYQATLLQCEFQMTLKMAAVRFWMFEKSDPGKIIGTVSFQNIMRSVYQSARLAISLLRPSGTTATPGKELPKLSL